MTRIIASLLFLVLFLNAKSQTYEAISPNSLLKIKIELAEKITYSVFVGEKRVIQPSIIGLELYDGRLLGDNSKVINVKRNEVNGIIQVVNGKNKELTEHYNEVKIEMDSFALIVRAYDEGVAYRFETFFPNEIIIKQEEANFNFDGNPNIWFGEAEAEMKQWERSYYPYSSISDIGNNKFAITPCLVNYPEESVSVVVAESDLNDYPGMFVQKSGSNSLKGKWAEYPKRVQEGDYEYKRVLERYDYISRSSGTRLFPWRVMIISTQDKDLLNNELIYKLAKPQILQDVSWVQPGKSVWEWWHDAILTGVTFPSGTQNLNYTLYKYYVDFAAANGIEYITLDAGWNSIYIKELCQYAAQKKVKVILWYYFNLVVVNPHVLDTFKSYGASGVKVDLIERDDQIAVGWFEFIASECAKRKLVVSFHGCAKPTGLQRAYPNIVNFEAVRGAECAKWDYSVNPNYHLQFPFMRMLAGTLDYTPGSLRNVHYEQFTPIPVGVPETIGTRTHEMAMYVVYDQTLAYLCDAPTEYEKSPKITEYISKIPTTWDRTLPLSGSIGKYAAIARQKGNEWYVGALTNLESRDILIDFSFLEANKNYSAEIMRDSHTSSVNAKSYVIESIPITNQTHYTANLARGGGFMMHITLADNIQTSVPDKDNSQIRMQYSEAEQTLHLTNIYPIKSIQITDILGHKQIVKNGDNHQFMTIPLKDLSSGIYLVTVLTSQECNSIKFFKR